MKRFVPLLLLSLFAYQTSADELRYTALKANFDQHFDSERFEIEEAPVGPKFFIAGIEPKEPLSSTSLSEFVYQFAHLNGELFQTQAPLLLISESERGNLRHLRFSNSVLGVPVYGSDIRFHFRNDTLVATNGHASTLSPETYSYLSQWASSEQLQSDLVDRHDALDQALQSYGGLQRFDILNENTFIFDDAPYVRHEAEITISRGATRLLVTIDALTGRVVSIEDRVNLHRPLPVWGGQQQ